MLDQSITGFDPMYGPAVRCKSLRRAVCAVLHQCIRPLIGACSWPSWISARLRAH